MVAQAPLTRELRPAAGMTYTSSTTLPSLVLGMPENLDVADGHRVGLLAARGWVILDRPPPSRPWPRSRPVRPFGQA